MRTLLAGLLLFLFLPSQAQDITISEINYKSHITLDCGDWIELYNFGATPIALDNWTIVDTSTTSVPYTFPVGTTVAAGARLVVFRKFSNFQVFFPTVTNKIGPFSFKINGTDKILLKNAAGALVAEAALDNSFGWPKGGDGEGRTNELVNQGQKTNLLAASDWRDGCMLGSPGTAPQTCVDPLIFTEINYNSNDTFDQGEWIELYNNSNASIDLTGYFLRDAFDTTGTSSVNTYYFPSGTTLAAGSYLVISNDSAKTRAYHPTVPANKILGNFAFNLGNQGELVKLFNPSTLRLTFSNHYNDTIPWPKLADGGGYTLELKLKNGMYNDGTNWETGCKLGSPGGPKVAPCATVWPLEFLENVYWNAISIYPNPSTQQITIDAGRFQIAKVTIVDIAGKTLAKYTGDQNTLDISFLPKGMYYLEVENTNLKKITKKLIVE